MDQTSKKAFANLLFKVEQLFGATLDYIIRNLTFLLQSEKEKELRCKQGPSLSAHKQLINSSGPSDKGYKPFKAPMREQKQVRKLILFYKIEILSSLGQTCSFLPIFMLPHLVLICFTGRCIISFSRVL